MTLYEIREKYYTRQWSSGKCREGLIEHGITEHPSADVRMEFVGPGPMTDAEALEYAEHELKFMKEGFPHETREP